MPKPKPLEPQSPPPVKSMPKLKAVPFKDPPPPVPKKAMPKLKAAPLATVPPNVKPPPWAALRPPLLTENHLVVQAAPWAQVQLRPVVKEQPVPKVPWVTIDSHQLQSHTSGSVFSFFVYRTVSV
jgi:hypothetical protein